MKTKHFSRFAALAAVVIAVGCGGEGTAHLPSGVVNFNGSETILGQSTTNVVVPPTGGTEITVTGVSGTTIIPSGVEDSTVTTDDHLAIIPAGTGFLGVITAGQTITVNGVTASGATVNNNGLLGVNIALPVTPGDAGTFYDLVCPAQALNTSRVLHVGNVEFRGTFYVKFSPLRLISPVPIDLKGSLPNDGENAFGSFMNVWWNPNNAGRQATLFIDYGNGFTLQQTRTIDSTGYAAFRNFVPDPSNVPTTGVQLVRFTVGPLP